MEDPKRNFLNDFDDKSQVIFVVFVICVNVSFTRRSEYCR